MTDYRKLGLRILRSILSNTPVGVFIVIDVDWMDVPDSVGVSEGVLPIALQSPAPGQFNFSDLQVHKDGGFEVTLLFNQIPTHLVVPGPAVSAFRFEDLQVSLPPPSTATLIKDDGPTPDDLRSRFRIVGGGFVDLTDA
jgi:hypothetical protein